MSTKSDPPPNVDILRVEVHGIKRSLDEMRDTHKKLVWWIAGLVVVGAGALMMVGAYKERVDTIQDDVSDMKVAVRNLQIDVYGARRGIPPVQLAPLKKKEPHE